MIVSRANSSSTPCSASQVLLVHSGKTNVIWVKYLQDVTTATVQESLFHWGLFRQENMVCANTGHACATLSNTNLQHWNRAEEECSSTVVAACTHTYKSDFLVNPNLSPEGAPRSLPIPKGSRAEGGTATVDCHMCKVRRSPHQDVLASL